MGIVEPLETFLKRLAVVAMGLSTTSAAFLSAQLSIIPVRAVEQVIEDSEDADWDDRDRLRVRHLLVYDPREAVRRQVALSVAAHPDVIHPDEAELLVGRLAADPSPAVRQLALYDLVALLARQPPLRQTDLVCRWATDPDGRKRLAVATVLGLPLEINGARTALAHLLHDESPAIRAAAAHALEQRG